MSTMTLNKLKEKCQWQLCSCAGFFLVNYNTSNIASMHILNGVEK